MRHSHPPECLLQSLTENIMTYKKLIPILLLAFAQTACLTSTPQNFNFDSVPVVDPSTSDPQISENENTASDSQTRKLPFSSIDAIELSHTEMTLKPNQRARLILQNVFLENGARYKKINSTFQTPYGHNESVLWISGDSSVTEIDSEGFLNAKSPGIAIVSAQLGEITAFAQITVLDFEISSPTAPLPEDTIPDEEAIVYGIKSSDGEKGVFVAGFSANSESHAAQVLLELSIKK